jgi:hypothetical protein
MLGEDSKPQPGVPKGTIFSFVLKNSTAFPGTERTIAIYVPAEYTGKEPACVFVTLDGLGYNIPTVFDNLIVEGLAFGGTDFKSLYAYSGGRVYVRELKAAGAKPATMEPIAYK